MTTPPPGQWPPQQPPGFPPGPPQWGPPPQWGQQPPPQNGGNRSKWIIGGLVLLVVVVVTVVTTLLFTRDSSDGRGAPTASAPPSTSVDTSDIASADDKGPVGIITEDPTCQRWTGIATTFGQAANNGWGERNPGVPASAWTPDQRNQYEAVGAAMRGMADRAVELARSTPHRVMRELYEQFIAYARAYADRIGTYTEKDDRLVRVAIGASSALSAICDAITYGSAGARDPLVATAAPPADHAASVDPAQPERFLASESPICSEWLAAVDRYAVETAAWQALDPNIPANELDPVQREINAQVMPVMREFATEIQLLGRDSDDATVADLATLSAQYLRAYASALSTYAPADDYLQVAAGAAGGMITEACRAAGA